MEDTHTQVNNGILLGHREEEEGMTRYSMGAPWGHCAEWNKPDAQGAVRAHLCEAPLKSRAYRQRVGWREVARPWRVGRMGSWYLMGDELQLEKM